MMGAIERTSMTFIYSSGYVTERSIAGINAPVTFYFSENDGARFLKRGPETELHINIREDLSSEDLDKLLDNLNKGKIYPRVRQILEEMVETGELKSTTYVIR